MLVQSLENQRPLRPRTFQALALVGDGLRQQQASTPGNTKASADDEPTRHGSCRHSGLHVQRGLRTVSVFVQLTSGVCRTRTPFSPNTCACKFLCGQSHFGLF